MRILIVGGGLGGMALAAFLQQRGLRFELLERAGDLSDQGFALGLWSNGRAVLQRLGVAEEFDAWGTPIGQYEIRGRAIGPSERRLRTFSLEGFEERFGSGYVQVSRRRLHGMLAGRVDAARVRMGARFVGLQASADGVRVRWVSGGEAGRSAAAVEHEDLYDVIVGADGVHSAVRAAAMEPGLERFTGWRSWYGWIDKSHVPSGTMVEHLGPGHCAALFDDAHGERDLGVFFAAQQPGRPAETPAAVRDIFAPAAAGLREALESAGQTVRLGADLASVRLGRWTAGGVALLGDAAHAFEPHNGLGASMAMEDADALAEQLDRAAGGQQVVAAALASYERLRRPRVALAQRISDRIRRLAFIERPLWRALGNLALPIVPTGWFERDFFPLFESSTRAGG